ncbi:MAG TPA: VPDSG-CTERM sorting domain-containing protein [Terriglobales bacterium]|nr:VPDSG-CTERM sorting domain-containing protein [Terriglobales bacterium]
MSTMNIRSRVLLCIAVLFASLAALSSTASATSLILDLGPYQSGVGGEFNVYSASLNPTAMGYSPLTMANVGHGMGFETFCLEYSEHFTPGGTYNYAISQAAIHGGIPGGSDPLSLGTAWLYLNFAEGLLTGYNFTNGANRTINAGQLQDTIWWLEGERPDPGAGDSFRNLVITQFGSAANAMADNNGFYGVAVLNLYYLDGSLAQDQLVLVPDSGTTAVLLAVGLLGLFLFHRKVEKLKS